MVSVPWRMAGQDVVRRAMQGGDPNMNGVSTTSLFVYTIFVASTGDPYAYASSWCRR